MKNLFLISLMLCLFSDVFAGPTMVDMLKVRAGGTIEFEGATNDAFETTLQVIDPTGDNLITFKDASGTVAFVADIAAGAITGCGTGSFGVIFIGGCPSTVIGNAAWDQDITTACTITFTAKDLELSCGDILLAENMTIGSSTGSQNISFSEIQNQIGFIANSTVIGDMKSSRFKLCVLLNAALGVTVGNANLTVNSVDIVHSNGCFAATTKADCLTGNHNQFRSDSGGFKMIDSCISSCTFMIGTATSGVPQNSNLSQSGSGNIIVAGGQNILSDAYGFNLVAEPSNPPACQSIEWYSSGCGAGCAGDKMTKVNVACCIKTITVIDFSTF